MEEGVDGEWWRRVLMGIGWWMVGGHRWLKVGGHPNLFFFSLLYLSISEHFQHSFSQSLFFLVFVYKLVSI